MVAKAFIGLAFSVIVNYLRTIKRRHVKTISKPVR